MRLSKFLQGLKQSESKDWSDRVSFWPREYPHRITTYADVAAIKHIMRTSGVLNVAAIDLLVRDENFWWDLLHFFQGKVDELGKVEEQWMASNAAVRKVPLYCWESKSQEDVT